jgi:hypothetical protein
MITSPNEAYKALDKWLQLRLDLRPCGVSADVCYDCCCTAHVEVLSSERLCVPLKTTYQTKRSQPSD